MGIFLYTTFYNEKNLDRRSELEEAIRINSSLSPISKIYVFNEGDNLSSINPKKIVDIPISSRPTYLDFIKHINSNNPQDNIHLIANTDIFFDQNIEVLNRIELKDICLALGRWDTTEVDKPVLYDHNDSQDVWVFKGEIKKELLSNYPLGVPRCDNRFMYDLELAGYQVRNPAFSIKAYHLHKGQVHVVYSEEDNTYHIKGPYRYLYPHNQYSFIKTIMFNLQNKNKLGSYKYDIKKVNQWLILKVWRRIYKLVLGREFPLIGYDSLNN